MVLRIIDHYQSQECSWHSLIIRNIYFWFVGAPTAKTANNGLFLPTSNIMFMQKLQAIRPLTNAPKKEVES